MMMESKQQQEISIAKRIAEVRKTGRVNMFDREGVARVMSDLGYQTTPDKIRTMSASQYSKLLALSGKY